MIRMNRKIMSNQVENGIKYTTGGEKQVSKVAQDWDFRAWIGSEEHMPEMYAWKAPLEPVKPLK
jgi:hypothetical protein